MPSRKTTTPILASKTYHLFNRGINAQSVFFTDANYYYFLKLLKQYLSAYCQFYSYCLLSNHFHLMIRINDFVCQKGQIIADEVAVGKVFANQFRSLIITYTMSINKQERRIGSLFSARYKRLEVESEEYFRYLVFYCHYNPEKHRVVDDFKNYRFSSYQALISAKPTYINKAFVLDQFGEIDDFINYHNMIHEERSLLMLED